MAMNVSGKSYKSCACAACAVSAVLGSAVPATAAEIVFQQGRRPDASYVQNATSISSEYVSSTVRAVGDLMVGNNKAGSSMRALLDFDLSAIPAGSVIRSVSVRLTQSADPQTPAGEKLTVELCLFNGTVDEKTSCWKNSEENTGALLQAMELETLSGMQTKERAFDASPALTGAVQSALSGGTKLNLVLKVKDENYIGRRLLMFRGNEDNRASSRPQLVVEFEPGVMVGARTGVMQAVLAAR